MENVEEMVSVCEENVGSRKRKHNDTDRERRKKARYSDPFAPFNSFVWKSQPCKHIANNSERTTFQCYQITENDVSEFRKTLFANESKIQQDNFLLQHTKLQAAARSRTLEANRKRDRSMSVEYFVKGVSGKRFHVCRQTFESIVKPIGKTRITGVLKRSFTTGQVASETRGGDRIKDKNLQKKNSIRNFIGRLKARESHYGRGKSVRLYLPSQLKNIRTLHRMYNNCEPLKVKFSMFYEIFSKEYNLSFNNPRVDVCTTCESLRNRLKAAETEDTKQALQTQLRIHKRRSKAFYTTIRDKSEDPHTIVIVYDLQQVQALPQVPIQEAYYSRQLGLYNFGVCDNTNKKNYSYTWTENQSERGANEVSSAVHHFLTNVMPMNETFKSIRHVILASDGCGGQNKNNIVTTMVQTWFWNAPEHIETVTMLFPERGHSFLPCDRLFGRISKDIRSQEKILLPEDYHTIFSSHVNSVYVYPKDWSVHDWKSRYLQNYKPLNAIQTAKRILFVKETHCRKGKSIKVSVEPFFFNNTGIPVSLLKRGCSHLQRLPSATKTSRPISQLKMRDVHNLLTRSGLNFRNDPRLIFYKEIQQLSPTAVTDDLDTPHEDCNCADQEQPVEHV